MTNITSTHEAMRDWACMAETNSFIQALKELQNSILDGFMTDFEVGTELNEIMKMKGAYQAVEGIKTIISEFKKIEEKNNA